MNEQIKLAIEGYNKEKLMLTEIMNGKYNPSISIRLTEIDEVINNLLIFNPTNLKE